MLLSGNGFLPTAWVLLDYAKTLIRCAAHWPSFCIYAPYFIATYNTSSKNTTKYYTPVSNSGRRSPP